MKTLLLYKEISDERHREVCIFFERHIQNQNIYIYKYLEGLRQLIS